MIRQFGENWINDYIKIKLREAYKNITSSVLENEKSYESNLILENEDLLTDTEKKQIKDIIQNVKNKKAEAEAAVIQRSRALFGFTGRKGCVGGWVSLR